MLDTAKQVFQFFNLKSFSSLLFVFHYLLHDDLATISYLTYFLRYHCNNICYQKIDRHIKI